MTNDPHDAAEIQFACLGQAFSRFPPDLFDTQESAHAVSSSGIQNKNGCQPDQVTIQSRVARNKFCCGLGVRAVRAGSIGRDDPASFPHEDAI